MIQFQLSPSDPLHLQIFCKVTYEALEIFFGKIRMVFFFFVKTNQFSYTVCLLRTDMDLVHSFFICIDCYGRRDKGLTCFMYN